MADYRLYFMTGTGHFSKGEWVQAKSDDEILAVVRAMKLATGCEIWDGNRLVAHVPAPIDRPSA